MRRTLVLAVATMAVLGLRPEASVELGGGRLGGGRLGGGRLKPASTAAPAGPSRLFKDSRQQLAIARAQGRREVVLLVSAVRGSTARVAQEAERVGGNVRFRDDDVDYLRIRLPIDRVSAFAEFDQIESAALDRDESYPGRLTDDEIRGGAASGDQETKGGQETTRQETGDQELLNQSPQEQWPPRWSDYPLRNPYSPLSDLGAAEFMAKNPTFDGRGVTIAVLDGNFDLLLPEFQTAYDVNGKRVPKVADFLNVSDPRDDADEMPQWVDMRQQVTVTSGRFSHAGKNFNAPRDGQFRVGLFDERKFNVPANAAYIDQDVDRNGNPKGDDGLFGVLWDEKTNDVWVDTNRDLSFADERALTDYIKRPEIGVFGKDDPSTPVRDTIGFAVQTDAVNKFVSINLGIYQHATIILGSVVGNREPAGRISGVAPGARVVSMNHMGIAHAMVEGVIAAGKHPLVDLIVVEQHVGIATLPYVLADARHPITITIQRVIERSRKLLFVPGSNAPGFAIVGEEGLAPAAVSVGGYQSRESYRLNNGLVTEEVDNLHSGALSHGPSGIGAMKPDLIAPSGQMSTDPGYRKGRVSAGLYQLPPGYSVDGGTSTATPMAAGATALVVSAAKQSQLAHDAFRLKAALTGSARHIPRLDAHEQGSGLIQVGAAFDLLRKLQSVEPVTIVTRAPVRTVLSPLLVPANQGVGLFEREGWKVGDRAERVLTITRTSGPRGDLPFTITWRGNDGTFSSASSIALGLNVAAQLPIVVTAKDAGVHTALLNLETPSFPGYVHRVLNSIVVPLQFAKDKDYSVTADVTVPRPGDRPVFVEVPAGAAALTFSASSKDGAVRTSLVSPSREWLTACFAAAASEPCAVARPEPGVWEINVSATNETRTFDPEREQPVKPVRVKVTAGLAGVDVAAGSVQLQSAVDSAAAFTPSISNRFAPVSASASIRPLGSARSITATIARGEQHAYEIMVPKGSTSVRARVVSDDPQTDLDLYLLDCRAPEKAPAAPPKWDLEKGNKSPTAVPPTCTPRAKATTAGPIAEVEVPDPADGRWVVVVDGYSVSGAPVAYRYMDVFEHPRFGTLAVADTPDKRGNGATWSPRAHVWVAAIADAPRTLIGRIVVTSPSIRTSTQAVIPLGAAEFPITRTTSSATR